MEVGFEVSCGQATLSVAHSLFLLPEEQDVELSAPFLTPTPPACHHAFCPGSNGLNLLNCELVPIKFFPLKS